MTVHPSHTSHCPKNERADRTLSLIRVVADRRAHGQTLEEIRDDLVPTYLDAADFHLVWHASSVRS